MCVGATLLVAFLYRYYAIIDKETEFHSKRTLIKVILVYITLTSPLIALFLYSFLYDPEAVELEVKEVCLFYDWFLVSIVD